MAQSKGFAYDFSKYPDAVEHQITLLHISLSWLNEYLSCLAPQDCWSDEEIARYNMLLDMLSSTIGSAKYALEEHKSDRDAARKYRG